MTDSETASEPSIATGKPTKKKRVRVRSIKVDSKVERKVSASLLAKIVSEKCALGLPLDRQRREFVRMGLDIPDKTRKSYWNYVTDLLEPASCAVMSDVFSRNIIGADDSHLKRLNKSHKHGVFRGHIWCFVGPDGNVGEHESVAYAYTKSWEATEVVDLLASIRGYEQTAIAAVLSDMDAELTALEQCRDKTKLLKQGMMQELLPGRPASSRRAR